MSSSRPFNLTLRRVSRVFSKIGGFLNGDFSRVIGGPVDEAVAARIRAEQLVPILRYSLPLGVANIFNLAVLIAALTDVVLHNLLAMLELSVWAACMLGVFARIYARRFGSRRPRPTEVSARSIRKAVLNGLVLGIMWGLIPALFFPVVSSETRVVLTCITAGMLGGGAFALASLPSAALGMIIPLMIGSFIGVAQIGGLESLLIVLLLGAYGAILCHGTIVHGLQIVRRLVSTMEIERIARSDALTNLGNRASFREAVQAAEARLQRNAQPCTVFFIDIDHFKDVNDTHGHAAGDEILIESARRLLSHSRSSDLVARLGGDEMAILVPGLDAPAIVSAFCDRLVHAFRVPFTIGDKSLPVSISVGAAICNSSTPGGTRTLLHQADLALYRAKHKGRDTWHVYHGDEEGEALQGDRLERDLRTALTNGELSLVFQPILEIETRRITGFEALLRWEHPKLGWIAPTEILAVAEERGLCDDIGAFVFREACAIAVHWPEDLRLAVNVSPAQLRSRTILTHVDTALSIAGLAPERLEIEVTEAAIQSCEGIAPEILIAFHARGIQLSLDDFGASQSILNNLRNVPFDRVKIDRCFVREMIDQRDMSALVRSVIGLAGELGLKVIAEGVETEEQLAVLRRLGCAEAQGFLFGEALPVTRIAGFLENRRTRLVA